jgi:hypothetical protein
MVALLLDHGADPNGSIDSSGSATYAAKTRELRALLLARGGRLDTYDLVWLDEDDEAVRRVAADPRSADEGCGGVLAAACSLGKRELLVRLLDAGARVPPVLTACRSYLLSDPAMLRLLLASGMNPDLPNWQRATPLHDLCGHDSRGRAQPHRAECATILLEAGATISAKDEDYRSTPLAWAARNDLPDMVELLLARGAPTNLPDDEAWATPLAWATRRDLTSIDVEVAADHDVSRIARDQITEHLLGRHARVVVNDQQARLGLSGKIGQLGSRRVVLGGEPLKRLRSAGQPRGCLDLVDQHVAATTGIDGGLGRVRVARDDDGAIRRLEAISIAFHGVLGREGRHGDVLVLVDEAGPISCAFTWWPSGNPRWLPSGLVRVSMSTR